MAARNQLICFRLKTYGVSEKSQNKEEQERILLLSKVGFFIHHIVKVLELERGIQGGLLKALLVCLLAFLFFIYFHIYISDIYYSNS